MRTNGQINVRQTYNVPFVEIRTSPAVCLTVNTGQDTNISISNGKHCSHFASFIGYVVGIMQYLVVVLHTLINVVVNVMLRQLAYQAINPRICDKVDIFRVTIRPHDWVNVAQNLGCHLGWHLYNVTGLRVIEQCFEHLRFVRLQCGNGSFIQSVRQRTGCSLHFSHKVMVVRNFVV